MLGHIIVKHQNKEGVLYVPEVEMFITATPGGRKDWVDSHSTDGPHYDTKDMSEWFKTGERPKSKMSQVEWLRQNYDFVKEIDVPLLMIRFAIEADEKKRKQIDAFSGLLEGMVKEKPAPLDIRKDVDFKVMERGVHRVKEIMESKEPGEITDAKKYVMALQIQRWIHEAGGLC